MLEAITQIDIPALMPKSATEFLAVLSASGSLIVLAGSAFWRVMLHAREQKEKEWARLHQLVEALYNRGGALGLWQQIAAIRELDSLAIHRNDVNVFAKLAHSDFASKNSQLAQELDRLAKRTSHSGLIRLFYRLQR